MVNEGRGGFGRCPLGSPMGGRRSRDFHRPGPMDGEGRCRNRVKEVNGFVVEQYFGPKLFPQTRRGLCSFL